MTDQLQYYAVSIAVFLVGLLLYGIGNLVFGKKSRGGKRLVLFIAGLVMLAFGALLSTASVLFWLEGSNVIFVFLLAVFGLLLLGCSGRAVWHSFSSDSAKVEKSFDSLTDGF